MNTNQKIVIFSGHDYSGKTTIAKALSKEIGIPYFKDKTTLKKFDEKDRWLVYLNDQIYIIQFLEQAKYSVIIDRAYESEWVYSQVFRRKQNFVVLDDLDYRFSLLGTKMIICEKDLKKYKDEVIEIEKIAAIKKRYREFCQWSKCESLIINTSDENLISQIKIIKEFVDV